MHTIKSFFLNTIAFVLLLFVSFQSLAQKSDLVKEAEALSKAGKSKKALNLINSEIKKNGLKSDMIILKAELLYNSNPESSWEFIRESMSMFPEKPEPYYARGIFFYNIRQMDNSVKDYTKALEYCKDDSLRFSILTNRSTSLHHLNRLDESIADCRETMRMRPNSLDAMNNLSTVLFDKGDTAESISVLLKMKSIDSTYTGVYVNLGYQLQQMGRYADAEKYLLEGVKVSPKEAFMYNNLGYAQFKLGKTEEAIRNIEKSLKLNYSNSYAYRNLALIYLEKNDKAKACENLGKALNWHFTEMYGNEVKDLRQKYCL